MNSLNRQQWKALPARGRCAVRAGSLLVIWHDTQAAAFGLTVSTKVGKAVVRNRVARLLRESVKAELAHEMGTWIIVASPNSAGLSLEQLQSELRQARSKVVKRR